jgi:hypothetical protein
MRRVAKRPISLSASLRLPSSLRRPLLMIIISDIATVSTIDAENRRRIQVPRTAQSPRGIDAVRHATPAPRV